MPLCLKYHRAPHPCTAPTPDRVRGLLAKSAELFPLLSRGSGRLAWTRNCNPHRISSLNLARRVFKTSDLERRWAYGSGARGVQSKGGLLLLHATSCASCWLDEVMTLIQVMQWMRYCILVFKEGLPFSSSSVFLRFCSGFGACRAIIRSFLLCTWNCW